MDRVRLPNNWGPRPYQRALWEYLENGGKRAIAVWHRRAGKDDVALHWTATAAAQRVGVYWHMLPEAAQARKAVWDAVNPHTGMRRIDEAFPAKIRATTREQEMFIRFVNGATWQVVGSDNYNSLVGSPPIGVVFSEWSLAKPGAWSYLRPILAENGGWALFIFTSRGRNHAAKMFFEAQSDGEWFAERLVADKTGVFTPERLAKEHEELLRENGPDVGEALYQQEYFCSFDAPILGAFYAKEMQAAENDGRIGVVPYDPSFPVTTAWDLGKRDDTSIWFTQWVGLQLRVIDFETANGQGLDYYAKLLKDKPYSYEQHLLPHDAAPERLGMTGNIAKQLNQLGVKPTKIMPRDVNVQDGITAARRLFPKCWFDAGKCKDGLEALRQYRREWSEDKRVFSDTPVHDWASHPADAFRTLAQGNTAPPRKRQSIKYSDKGII